MRDEADGDVAESRRSQDTASMTVSIASSWDRGAVDTPLGVSGSCLDDFSLRATAGVKRGGRVAEGGKYLHSDLTRFSQAAEPSILERIMPWHFTPDPRPGFFCRCPGSLVNGS
jgi:hypothetical protein